MKRSTQAPTPMRDPSKGPGPLILLALIVAFLAVVKIRHNDRAFFTSIDGGLYTDIAEHVRDGEGIITDISPYHHGYPYFPHPTAIYPLWPLLYGYATRIVPIPVAGVWLPTLGYLAALVFAYLWATALLPGRKTRPEIARRLPGDWTGALERWRGRVFPDINAGHVLVLLLGLNIKFFQYTSMPYTEGLAYALLFAFLWRFQKIGTELTWPNAAEIGLWTGVLMLVRSQFVIVALATAVALAAATLRTKRIRDLAKPLLSGTVFAGVLLPWYLYVAGFITQHRLMSMFRYDQARVNGVLSPYRAMAVAEDGGLPARVKDVFAGMLKAFSPSYEWSYARTFHALPYLLPLALILFVVLARKDLRKVFCPALAGPGGANIIFLGSISAGAFASLHLMHIDSPQEWLFSHRHAILMLVPMFLAWRIISCCGPKLLRIAAMLMVVYTIVCSFMDTWNAADSEEGVFAAQRAMPLAHWMVRKGYGDSHTVVVAPRPLPQLLAPFVPGAGFHGVYPSTTRADLRALFEVLHADVLILRDTDLGEPPFFRSFDRGWFTGYFEVQTRLAGATIFVKRRPPVPEANLGVQGR